MLSFYSLPITKINFLNKLFLTDKNSNKNDLKDSIERMVEAINTPLPSVKLSPMPQVTEFDSFGVIVATKLKNLSRRKSNAVMCEILKILCNTGLEENVGCEINTQNIYI